MYRQGELHCSQAGGEVAPRGAGCGNDQLAYLGGQSKQLVMVEEPQVAWRVDASEDRTLLFKISQWFSDPLSSLRALWDPRSVSIVQNVYLLVQVTARARQRHYKRGPCAKIGLWTYRASTCSIWQSG